MSYALERDKTRAYDALKARRYALDALVDDYDAHHILGERAQQYFATLRAGGRLAFLGNGGAEATAQHMAAEYVGRFRRDRRGAAALALASDPVQLTALANDFGYDAALARLVEAQLTRRDLFIVHTTSGGGTPLWRAVQRAIALKIPTVGVFGPEPGVVGALLPPEARLHVVGATTAIIQEQQLMVEHVIADMVDERLALVGDR